MPTDQLTMNCKRALNVHVHKRTGKQQIKKAKSLIFRSIAIGPMTEVNMRLIRRRKVDRAIAAKLVKEANIKL